MSKVYVPLLFSAAWLFVLARPGPALGQPTGDSIEFETSVVVEDDVDTQIKAQIEQRISVAGKVTEGQLRAFLEERYQELSERGGFTHYDGPTNIYIYVFGSEERAEDGGAGWMGAVMKGSSDEEPRIQAKTDQIEDYNQGPETRLELEEEKRKEIFKAIVRAEDRAMEAAQNEYPNDLDQQADVRRKLENKYRAEVREKYGITEAVQDSITAEALEKRWPLPEP